MVETIDRLNHDTHFANAFPFNEDKLADGTYHFNIGVDYKPSMTRVVE